MNKTELAERVALKTGISRRLANKILNAAFQSCTDALVEGDKIVIQNFGTFEIRERTGWLAKNFDNCPVYIPQKRVAFFVPGKALKEQIEASK